MDAKPEDLEEGEGNEDPKGKDNDKDPKGKGKVAKKGGAAGGSGGGALKVSEARKRAAEANTFMPHPSDLPIGSATVIFAVDEWDFDEEEARFEAHPDVPTIWYQEDLKPCKHTPVLCGVVVEDQLKKPVTHFGHPLEQGLLKDELSIKVWYLNDPTCTIVAHGMGLTWPYLLYIYTMPVPKLTYAWTMCLQITEFHWTLYDPRFQTRVKTALFDLFEQVEGRVPEKHEFKQFFKEIVKGKMPADAVCSIPVEHATQRYDAGKELLYWLSGKPEGLTVPKVGKMQKAEEKEEGKEKSMDTASLSADDAELPAGKAAEAAEVASLAKGVSPRKPKVVPGGQKKKERGNKK